MLLGANMRMMIVCWWWLVEPWPLVGGGRGNYEV